MTLVTPQDGRLDWIGGMGVRVIRRADSVSVVEHPLAPRALAAPLHRHMHEDEISIVLEGRVGAQLGDEVLEAGPGDVVVKPRGPGHPFWNAGDQPARLIEAIAPGGFEGYFLELTQLDALTPELVMPIAERYGLELDPASIPGLCERHGVVFGPAEGGGA